MTKILYLMDQLIWGRTVAGTEGQFLQLLTHLDRGRFEPHLALFRPAPSGEPPAQLPCPVTMLDIHKVLHPGAMRKLARLSLRLRAERVSLVHIFLNDAAIVAPMFCRIGGARVIVSRRDMGFWYTASNLRALRVSNLFVSRILANSQAVKAHVHRSEHYAADRIEVIANGHDPARFEREPLPGFREQLGIGPDDPIVGMVANFNPWKRHVDLVRAFALVRDRFPSAHLVLVGTGATGAARQAARDLGLEPAVHIVEGVRDAIPVVKHFRVGVLCSDSEGSSNAVIEYMSCGKPTICTGVGGNGELVRDGETGFLMTPGDVAGLAAKIGTLLAQPELAVSMGHRARQSALPFTIQRMADAHMALYERLARTVRAIPIHDAAAADSL